MNLGSSFAPYKPGNKAQKVGSALEHNAGIISSEEICLPIQANQQFGVTKDKVTSGETQEDASKRNYSFRPATCFNVSPQLSCRINVR